MTKFCPRSCSKPPKNVICVKKSSKFCKSFGASVSYDFSEKKDYLGIHSNLFSGSNPSSYFLFSAAIKTFHLSPLFISFHVQIIILFIVDVRIIWLFTYVKSNWILCWYISTFAVYSSPWLTLLLVLGNKFVKQISC